MKGVCPTSPLVRRRSTSISFDDIPTASVATLVFSENDPRHPHTSTADDRIVIIWLTSLEEKLFETLVAAADAFAEGKVVLPERKACSVDIRVAGGWVRDKILGLETHDVDVALDSLSGKDFATVVQLYLQQHAPEEVHRVAVIEANPAQSKHLETATMKVYGMDVDFSNLRSQEVYEHGSRIPTTQFGSPLEDAERRDFTINALFFNLRTEQVEDWTQRGLVDLRKGIIETPLNPHTTFHDDPLRVLRAIRFAVRYDFKLHGDLQMASMSKPVVDSLHRKVSRERVGKELEGMLTGKGAKPAKALDTIDRLHLSSSVFCLPEKDISLDGTLMGRKFSQEERKQLVAMGWEESRLLLTLIATVHDAHVRTKNHLDKKVVSQVDVRLLHLAIFVMPFRYLTYTDKKGRVIPVVDYMFREGIKFKNTDVAQITTLVNTIEGMIAILGNASARDKDAPLEISRLDVGLLLRNTKELWVTSLMLATILKLREQETLGQHWTKISQRVYAEIVDMDLDYCWKMKPLLNGRSIIQMFELPFGPVVGVYLEEQVRWMLMNPEGTAEESEKHLRKFKHDLDHRQAEQEEVQASKRIHVEEKEKTSSS